MYKTISPFWGVDETALAFLNLLYNSFVDAVPDPLRIFDIASESYLPFFFVASLAAQDTNDAHHDAKFAPISAPNLVWLFPGPSLYPNWDAAASTNLSVTLFPDNSTLSAP